MRPSDWLFLAALCAAFVLWLLCDDRNDPPATA